MGSPKVAIGVAAAAAGISIVALLTVHKLPAWAPDARADTELHGTNSQPSWSLPSFPPPSPREDWPTITIVKDAEPNSSQDFPFAVNFCPPPGQLRPCVLHDFVLDDDDDPALANSFAFGMAGYTAIIGEAPPEGWTLTGITCDTDAEISVEHGSVRLENLPDQEFTCTFVNQLIGAATPTVSPSITAAPSVPPSTLAPTAPATVGEIAAGPLGLPSTGAGGRLARDGVLWPGLLAIIGSSVLAALLAWSATSRFLRRRRTR
jgi:hypothetical protein